MAGTTRITVTLPTEQVELLRQLTENVSGDVAEAVRRQLRRYFLAQEMAQYMAEYGEFTEAERAAAQTRIADAMAER